MHIFNVTKIGIRRASALLIFFVKTCIMHLMLSNSMPTCAAYVFNVFIAHKLRNFTQNMNLKMGLRSAFEVCDQSVTEDQSGMC